MQFTVSNEKIAENNASHVHSFPKYTPQLMNLANQNGQGTRPSVVGQLSELFPQFMATTMVSSPEAWEQWYVQNNPGALDEATRRVMNHIHLLQEAIQKITPEMVREWIHDLVITKTFNGLYVQKAILARLAEIRNTDYRLATPEEEAKGIDGYVGECAYSIKPETYKTMTRLPEQIDVTILYYHKTSVGLVVECPED